MTAGDVVLFAVGGMLAGAVAALLVGDWILTELAKSPAIVAGARLVLL